MADEVEEETTEEEENEPDEQVSEDTKLVRKLRRDLKARDKELKELRPLRETNAFLSAGLGELSETHKTALKAVVGDDVSKDNLIEKAKALGFVSEEGTTTNGAGGTETESEENGQIREEVATIHQAQRSATGRTATPKDKDFNTLIREAKNPQEIMRILAESGEERGLLVEEGQ